jgi:hypothetical protein
MPGETQALGIRVYSYCYASEPCFPGEFLLLVPYLSVERWTLSVERSPTLVAATGRARLIRGSICRFQADALCASVVQVCWSGPADAHWRQAKALVAWLTYLA